MASVRFIFPYCFPPFMTTNNLFFIHNKNCLLLYFAGDREPETLLEFADRETGPGQTEMGHGIQR